MRSRLTGAIAAVVALALAVFAVPLGLLVLRVYHDDELLRLQRDAIAATRSIDLPGSAGDPLDLPAFAGTLTALDAGGRRVAGDVGPVPRGLVARARRESRPADATSGGRLVVAVPVITRERLLGVVVASRTQGGVGEDLRRVWALLAGVAALVFCLALAVAARVARRLAVPLEDLARDAQRLGEGDFAVRPAHTGVAEIDEVADALAATAARLRELLARERAFTADASHQLRTPLAAARLELEALELRGATSPETQSAIKQIDRLQTTVGTLLEIARGTAPARGLHLVADLLGDVRERWAPLLSAAGRELVVHDRVGGAAVLASPPVLLEVLDVLLDNAIRHGEGEVTVTARAAGDRHVAIDVRDAGSGFADPRAAVAGNDRRTSHGIGLPLARSLSQAAGWRLDVRHPGPGPVVTLLLPTQAPPAAAFR